MLASKVWGVILVCAVGLSLSYIVVGLYVDKFPKYAYNHNLFPYKQLKPPTASAPKLRILPIGPVTPTTPAEDAAAPPGKPTASSPPTPLSVREAPPAPPGTPTVPSTPTPLSAREATPTMASGGPTPAVAPPTAAASSPRNAHQGLAPPAPLAMPPGRAEYHVQAGAFTQREYADTLIRQLRANGYTVTLAEGPPLRVWVGPAMSRPAAVQLATDLRSKGFEAFLSPIL
jgi:cell division septation protein DedD